MNGQDHSRLETGFSFRRFLRLLRAQGKDRYIRDRWSEAEFGNEMRKERGTWEKEKQKAKNRERKERAPHLVLACSCLPWLFPSRVSLAHCFWLVILEHHNT